MTEDAEAKRLKHAWLELQTLEHLSPHIAKYRQYNASFFFFFREGKADKKYNQFRHHMVQCTLLTYRLGALGFEFATQNEAWKAVRRTHPFLNGPIN